MDSQGVNITEILCINKLTLAYSRAGIVTFKNDHADSFHSYFVKDTSYFHMLNFTP